jgi:hypothetical protein
MLLTVYEFNVVVIFYWIKLAIMKSFSLVMLIPLKPILFDIHMVILVNFGYHLHDMSFWYFLMFHHFVSLHLKCVSWAGSVAQVVELPSKYEAQSANPSSTKK